MFKKIFPRVLMMAVIVLGIAAMSSLRFDVRVSPRDLAFGQASSYPGLPYAFGPNVNGKPTLAPTAATIDTQTAVAAGTLNGTNSTMTYDITPLRDFGRMINISLNVTAVPGTSPSLTPSVQQSDNGGQSWYTVDSQLATTFTTVTATGSVTGLDFPVYGDLLRIHYVSSGTGNFTFTVSATYAQ
jgi:hypothetical protein